MSISCFVKVRREASGISDMHGKSSRHLCAALRQVAQNLSGDHTEAGQNKVPSAVK